MSRIGKLPVSTKGVEVAYAKDVLTMKAAKGELSLVIPSQVELAIADEEIVVNRKGEDRLSRALHGTIRSRLNNMVVGLNEGFSKSLVYKGVGYSWAVQGAEVKMTLGYSHPVVENIPAGLTCEVDKDTMKISGIDKALVGEFAAKIRSWRKPEPYLGKGIRYSDERIIRKQGKKLAS